jgi:hypothetical protein
LRWLYHLGFDNELIARFQVEQLPSSDVRRHHAIRRRRAIPLQQHVILHYALLWHEKYDETHCRVLLLCETHHGTSRHEPLWHGSPARTYYRGSRYCG